MAKFCSECGAALLAETVKFCHECGSGVDTAVSRKPEPDGGQKITFHGQSTNSPVMVSGGDIDGANQHVDSSSHSIADSNNVSNTHNISDSYNTNITISDAFKTIYEQIEASPQYPEDQQTEIASHVQYLEEEVSRGEDADGNKVETWLGKLANMAPDIFDVAVATLINPTVGVTTAIGKIAMKMKELYGRG